MSAGTSGVISSCALEIETALVGTLQDLGVAVAAVDIRLAPEHRHPEPLNRPRGLTAIPTLIEDRRTARAAQ